MSAGRLLRWWALAAAVFALAALAGGPWLARHPQALDPLLEGLAGMVQPLCGSEVLLALFFFAKNAFVAVAALFFEQAAEFSGRTAGRVLGRLGAPERLLRLLLRRPARTGRLFPLAVLALNGAVLAGVCLSLCRSGAGGRLLLAGLAPHGVPELSALFLACGAGMSGAAPGEKAALFLRIVAPLLAAAAALEAWVTPEVMHLAG